MSDQQVDEQVEDKFGTDETPVEKQDAESSDLAEQALADVDETTAESAEKPEDQVPLSKYMSRKTGEREAVEAQHAAEVKTAELQGRLNAIEDAKTQAEQPQKSPIQVAMEKHNVENEIDLDISTGETMQLMRDQQKWDTAQTAKKTAADAETTRQTTVAELEKAAMAEDHGEGLDLATISKMGYGLLTEGELFDINKSTDPFKLAYGLMVRAIQERGDDSTKQTLSERLTRETEKTVVDEKPKKPDDPDEPESDDEERISNPRLAALAKDAVAGGSHGR